MGQIIMTKNMSTFVHTHLAALSDKFTIMIEEYICECIVKCITHLFDFRNNTSIYVHIELNACLIFNTTKSAFFSSHT